MKYEVHYDVIVSHFIEIEADSFQEAEDISDQIEPGTLIERFAEDVSDMDLSVANGQIYEIYCPDTGEQAYYG